MKYLSLFSGIGGFELAIHSVFPDAQCVGYSEIDKCAIQTYQKHYPDHPALGDVTKIDIASLPDFDLLVGGFPCQDLSAANANRQGLEGNRSRLFWNMVEILKAKKPRWFCFENIASMPRKDKDIISATLEVEPIRLDARLVSAQSRKRLFWCNWHVSQPQDRQIILKDVLEHDINIKPISDGWNRWLNSESGEKRKKMGMVKIDPTKSTALVARGY